MTDKDLADTQKKAFFQECENLTLREVLVIKFYAQFFRLKRIFRNLKNHLWM